MSVVLLQHDIYHAHMTAARMHIHITRTQQGDENSYIISHPMVEDIYATQFFHTYITQLVLQVSRYSRTST